MNINVIARYLQFLRKSHDYTQEDLAKKLDINSLCERLFPDIDFEMARSSIGRVRIETVEEMQNQIISMANLQGIDKEI